MIKSLQWNRLLAAATVIFGSSAMWAQVTFNYTGAVQTYTVPVGVYSINISAAGAQGGGYVSGGGLGATMAGDYSVTPGQTLNIVVGQMGLLQVGGDYQNSSGGGGGSFVYDASNTLFVAAGGGGGMCNYTGSPALHADAHGKTTPDGGANTYGQYLGGVAGNGGAAGLWNSSPCAGGGAGWLTVGGGPYGGMNASGNWAGGTPFCGGGGGGCGGYGGYGGGGGGGNHYGGGGGGGGYSGGGGATDPDHGGGGGSYSIGTNQNNVGGNHTGNGVVIITAYCTATIITPDSPTLADATGDCSVTPATPTASNNCGISVNGTPNVTFPVTTYGTTVVTWTYDDGNGNTTTQTQNIIVNGPNTGITQTGATLTANLAGATYQWIDCANGMAISGATNQSYTPTAVTGNYAVVVTANGCSDTSACFLVDYTGLGENAFPELSVYPNPSENGLFTLNFDGAVQTVRMTDMTGKVVDARYDAANMMIHAESLDAGHYFVTIVLDNTSVTKEVVILRK